MSGLGAGIRTSTRSAGAVLAVGLLQFGFVLFAMNASTEEPASVIFAGLLAAPFLLLVLLLWPTAVVLSIPVLLIVPGWIFGVSLAELVLLAVVFLAACRLLASGRLPSSPVAAEWVFLAFALWAGVSLFQAVDMRTALVGYKRVLFLLLAFAAGRRLVGARRAFDLVRIEALLGSLIALELLAVLLLSGASLVALAARDVSLTNLGWGYSNYVAAVAALTTAAGIPLVLHGRALERLVGIAGLASAVIVSIATTSRGGTLAIAIALAVAVGIEARRRFFVAVGLLILMVSAYLYSPLGQASLARFVDPSSVPSVATRILLYQESFGIFTEHPLFGVGPDQLPHHTAVQAGVYPHNLLLKIGMDFGLPGLVLYLALLGILVAKARRLYARARDRRGRILGLTFLLLLVVGVSNALYEPTIVALVCGGVFWILAGALTAASDAAAAEPSPT